MVKKTACLGLILLSFYTYLAVHYPDTWIQNKWYQSFLAFYGYQAGKRVEPRVIYGQGLRDLGEEKIKIKVLLPGKKQAGLQEVYKALEEGYTAVVECSILDSLHTTPYGKSLTAKMYNRAYRIVVFDGGHHLPTLGMAPDVIIIPEIKGYAAHSYMQDAIKTETIVYLAKEAGLKHTLIVSVPRWALVKEEKNLAHIVLKAWNKAETQRQPFSPFYPCAENRISKVNGVVFAYIGKGYYENIDSFIKCIKKLNLSDVHKIYLAFDYKYADRKSAGDYAKEIEERLRIPTWVVNEPFTAFDVLWGKRDVLWKQGHNP
ncbi:hypothetical protein SAMN02745221_01137 [Thermosyntropha lipolytica DSM 11003]|uniref:Uncharacterized protein n=1 Tax=Thermosyntropha lipolytica DSM 11003 TaxID=1123382 RepID=A0A1M5N9I2_9FIRM|nr:hypothetical protein [Thermosyntropha lipolytica]SHG86158.1 hypothetical protein SAMN02745221_01137 [Thermosyntropha lipolytica DSM 11003]